MRWHIQTLAAYRLVPLTCLLFVLALVSSAPSNAADILFIVDDDGNVTPAVTNGIPDKGGIEPGSDTSVGPSAHPALGLLERMQALGHTVTVRDDGPSSAADLVGKQLVVISS